MPIVEAVGTSAGHGLSGKGTLAKQIEAAMVAAVKECYAKDIRDPAIIREAQRRAKTLVMHSEA